MIDVQQDVVANAYRRDDVMVKINTLLDKARAAGTPLWTPR
ncbi:MULTISPECIES: hypothetical protein [Arthrobacter]|nr:MULTISPECIES: hypothetical protein [Arthrobacter]